MGHVQALKILHHLVWNDPKGPGLFILRAFREPKIQNWVNCKPPVLSYSEVGTYVNLKPWVTGKKLIKVRQKLYKEMTKAKERGNM